jgi:hypothetical protein
MTYSNLSKIKPKLRTSGRVSGNFGRSKVTAGSPLTTLGETTGTIGNLPTQDDYLERLYKALDLTQDKELKKYIYEQIRKISIQQGKW